MERNGDDELINEDEFITNLSILLNPTSNAINQTQAPQETIVEENDYQVSVTNLLNCLAC